MKSGTANLRFLLHKVGCLLLSVLLFVQLVQRVQPKEPADDAMIKHALAPFAGRTVDGIFDYLDSIRPAPIKDSDKAYLLRDMTLITGQAGVHDPAQIQKLRQRVRWTLALHRRINVIDFYIFRYPYPGAMNKPGAFIAITTTLLQMIGDDDAALIGIVSHELAHEYVASEMTDAHNKKDLAWMRELELFCDAVAVVSLVALGLDPSRYASILERIASSSEGMAKLNNGEREMPNIALRKRMIFSVANQLSVIPASH